MKTFGWCLLAGFGLLMLIGYAAPEPPPPISRSEEIREGCQREFGSDGPDAVIQCQTVIMVRELEKRRREAMERAAR